MDKRNGRDNDHRRSIHLTDGMDSHKCLASPCRQNNASTPSSAIPGVKGGKLVVVRLSGVVELQSQMLPSWDIIANAMLPQPWKHCMIVIGFAAPATFYKLKWDWNMFYFIGMLKYQRTTLKEDGGMHLYQASTLVC